MLCVKPSSWVSITVSLCLQSDIVDFTKHKEEFTFVTIIGHLQVVVNLSLYSVTICSHPVSLPN